MSEVQDLVVAPKQALVAPTSDPSAIAAAESARARIESAYTVALKKPRNQDEARIRILAACRRPAFAERVEYSKPVSGRAIVGPSIRFAEEALRSWGNVLTETSVVYEDQDVRRLRVQVIDLESNTTFGRDIQVKRTVERKDAKGRDVLRSRTNSYGETVYIVRATDEELANTEASAISKVMRNEGLRILPADIVDEAIEVARKTLADKDAADPEASRKRLIDAFAALGVRPQDLVDYLGHALSQLQPAELQNLRALHRSLADGETTWKAVKEAQEVHREHPKGPGGSDKLLDKLEAKKSQEEATGVADLVAEAKKLGQALGMKMPEITKQIMLHTDSNMLPKLVSAWTEQLVRKEAK